MYTTYTYTVDVERREQCTQHYTYTVDVERRAQCKQP